jgi:hypothetical protein
MIIAYAKFFALILFAALVFGGFIYLHMLWFGIFREPEKSFRGEK